MKFEWINDWRADSIDFILFAIFGGWDTKRTYHSNRKIYFGIGILGLGFSISIHIGSDE